MRAEHDAKATCAMEVEDMLESSLEPEAPLPVISRPMSSTQRPARDAATHGPASRRARAPARLLKARCTHSTHRLRCLCCTPSDSLEVVARRPAMTKREERREGTRRTLLSSCESAREPGKRAAPATSARVRVAWVACVDGCVDGAACCASPTAEKEVCAETRISWNGGLVGIAGGKLLRG